MTNIMIYNHCNQMCLHCMNPLHIKLGHVKATTDADITKAINQAKDFVMFTGGGEPTMVANLDKHIRHAKSRGLKVTVETNGMLFAYPKYLDKLIKSGMDNCVISVPSHVREICDKLTQTPGSYDLIIKGIENVQSRGIEIGSLLHTISKLNYKIFPDFVDFVKSFGLDRICIGFIRPIQGHKQMENITPRLTDIRKSIIEGFRKAELLNIKINIAAGLGVPACLIEGYEHLLDELNIYSSQGPGEHQIQSYAKEKIKGKQCRECSLDKCCAGLQQAYVNLYGTEELKPMKKQLSEIIK